MNIDIELVLRVNAFAIPINVSHDAMTKPRIVCPGLLIVLASVAAAQVCHAQPTPRDSGAPSLTNRVYLVSRFLVTYGPRRVAAHPDLPPLEELTGLEISLEKLDDIFVPPGRGGTTTRIKLGEFKGPSRFSAAALFHIDQALAARLLADGFAGVWATPDLEDIDPDGVDDRGGRQELRLNVYVGQVKQLRTIAKGKRVPQEQAINNPVHSRIALNSPLRSPSENNPGSLLDKNQLDQYLGRLNRFPGRSVEAAVSSAGEPGGVVLDYLVTEDKPWITYGQVANTGTKATGEWRERLGFIHQQLTSRDDILSLDFVTDFQRSYAFFGSYEIPLIFPDQFKTKVYGSYGEFTASELGISTEELSGSLGVAGAECIWSPLSFPHVSVGRLAFAPMYVDLTLGGKWKGLDENNKTFATTAGTDLAVPYLGVNLSSLSQKTKLAGGFQFEGQPIGDSVQPASE